MAIKDIVSNSGITSSTDLASEAQQTYEQDRANQLNQSRPSQGGSLGDFVSTFVNTHEVNEATKDLSPFRAVGTAVLPGLVELSTNPEQQAEYIKSNPFYGALADDAQQRVFNNQAARGKLGTGETIKELQKNLVMLGSDLLNQNITQRLNIANLGVGAATQIADIRGDINVARQNAAAASDASRDNMIGTAAGFGLAFALSDRRTKKDITKIGKLDNGLPVYTFRYKHDPSELRMSVMAQDVEKVKPEAVKEISGLKIVDMEKVSERI